MGSLTMADLRKADAREREPGLFYIERLLTMTEKYEFVATSLDAAREEIAALKAQAASLHAAVQILSDAAELRSVPPARPTMPDILSAAMRSDKPLDPYGR